MTKKLVTLILCLSGLLAAAAQTRRWTVADGLPTGEVHQIVELPNGQMLVNCESVFCLSNGRGFLPVPCDYSRAYRLPHYGGGYAHQWQGDSLLWLQDFYRIYLFDARTRSFRYDHEQRLPEGLMRGFKPSPLTVTDRQGGLWRATRQDGIVYQPPTRRLAERVDGPHPLIDLARSKADFATALPGHRWLLCDSLRLLAYFYPDRNERVSLNDRLPALNQYRHFVGACVIDSQWTAVYSQNGAFMLDTQADTLAPLPAAETIERYSDKYNCMLQDRQKRLWVGTQNGLFCEGRRVSGLANNCIRSLLLDRAGNVWSGTSGGVSRVTPDVVNYGPEDGIPTVSMMERAAVLADDGRLVFAYKSTEAVCFSPDSIDVRRERLPVVITWMSVGGEQLPLEQLTRQLSFPHHQNDVEIQFSALNYATPSHTRYRYRLAGLESHWTPYGPTSPSVLRQVSHDGSIGTAEYHALPPGDYSFQVQAAIDGGEWGDTAAIDFTICPPRWLTWWAKTLYLLVAAAAVVAALCLYLERKRKKMERENDQRVNRLFELREEARHQFAEAAHVNPGKIGVNEEERQLTERLLKAIEVHMADADYGVDQLAQDVFMSRSALYAKLRNMLGISPADFIRNVRLKRAAQLLDDSDLSIGEIADSVGYNTHKAFVANFKKLFGMLPSEYRQR